MKRLFICWSALILLGSPAIKAMSGYKSKALIGAKTALGSWLLWKKHDAEKEAMLTKRLAESIASCTKCTEQSDGDKIRYLDIAQKHDREIATTFVKLKDAMRIEQKVMLAFCENCDSHGFIKNNNNCAQHQSHTILGVKPHHNSTVTDFIIAHELAHIAESHIELKSRLLRFESLLYKKHMDSLLVDTLLGVELTGDFSPLNDDQINYFDRLREYEADKIAALTLGNIDSAMEFFGATRDASSATGWKLPPENFFGLENNGTDIIRDEDAMAHPSHTNRCRALLVLQEQCPETLKKPSVSLCPSLQKARLLAAERERQMKHVKEIVNSRLFEALTDILSQK